MQDKTLADYIKRVMHSDDKTSKVWHNRNVWNDPSLAEQDRANPYPVYPEQQGEEDRPRNPYSPV